MALLSLQGVTLNLGGKTLLDTADLHVEQGERVCLVGRNGVGKSSLMALLSGDLTPDGGTIVRTPGVTFGHMPQAVPDHWSGPVFGVVASGLGKEGEALAAAHLIATGREDQLSAAKLALARGLLQSGEGWERHGDILEAINQLGLDPEADFATLSGGNKRRVALARALVASENLLLDEPTNHLDAESILWLEQFLHQYKGAVIAVTHDRYFMDNVAEWICEVDRGHLYPYKGNYSTYLETKAKRMEIQGAKDAKLAKRLKSELDWVRSSPKARQAKNKARLERYDQMEQEARNNKKLDFSEIQIPAGPRLGSTVLEAEHIHKAFGDRVLIDDLSFTLPRNGIVGVIGPNGVGKSTLFKTIVGLEPLTSGSLKIGDTVKISYVDQNRAGLDPNKNLWEAVSDGLDFIEVAGVEVPTRAYVASFGFKGSDQQKLVGVLSGGERNRLNLALTLKQGGNLLLLDEPTNDLDVETLESLENALLAFPGCAVVISHDRWFLDRVATHILAWEGTDENPANWYWFEGNFQAYQENRIARLGEDAARPHRLHRKLTR